MQSSGARNGVQHGRQVCDVGYLQGECVCVWSSEDGVACAVVRGVMRFVDVRLCKPVTPSAAKMDECRLEPTDRPTDGTPPQSRRVILRGRRRLCLDGRSGVRAAGSASDGRRPHTVDCQRSGKEGGWWVGTSVAGEGLVGRGRAAAALSLIHI